MPGAGAGKVKNDRLRQPWFFDIASLLKTNSHLCDVSHPPTKQSRLNVFIHQFTNSLKPKRCYSWVMRQCHDFQCTIDFLVCLNIGSYKLCLIRKKIFWISGYFITWFHVWKIIWKKYINLFTKSPLFLMKTA